MNPSQNVALFSASEHVELCVTTNKGSCHKLHHLRHLIIQYLWLLQLCLQINIHMLQKNEQHLQEKLFIMCIMYRQF
jgi:hypothetical protein